MDRITLILAVVLAVYAALAGLSWLQRLIGERIGARQQGMALNLLRRAGPPVAGGLVVLSAGMALRLVGHVPLGGLLVAGGLAYGFHRGLVDVRQADRRFVAIRAFLALGLGLAILWQAGMI